MTTNYTTPSKVSNLNYLNELAKGKPEFVKEMIDIFLEDNREEIINLEKNIQNKDYLLIKEVAHKMKSTIAFVGLDHLIENELSEIEQMAIEKSDIRKIETPFIKVKEVCQKAAEELRFELKQSTQ